MSLNHRIRVQGSGSAGGSIGAFRLPIFELWLVLVLFVVYVGAPETISPPIVWGCLLLQYGLLVAAVWRPITLYPGIPTFVTAEFLFLFFSYLIYYYPYQLHVLGIYEVTQSRYFPGHTFPDESNRAILLSSIAMLAFRAGLRALGRRDRPSDHPFKANQLDRLTADAMALPVFALLVLLSMFYQIAGLRSAGEGRYGGTTFGGPLAEGVYLGITVLSMVAVALWVFPSDLSRPGRSIFLWLSAALGCAWALRMLLAGDRNSFLLIAIVAVGGFFTFRLRAGRWAIAGLCAVALTLYLAVEQLRSGQISSLLGFFYEEGPRRSFADADTSFNISTISLRAALASVPENYEYGYGLFKVIGFAGVLPFIRGFLIPSDMEFTQSSDILGAILVGKSSSWGVGSNIIADIYIDFGVVGVPLLLFALGLGVAYVQNAVMNLPSSAWRATFYMLTLALVAEIPRYSLAFPVRPLVWAFFLFLAVSWLSRSQDEVPLVAEK